MPNKTIKDDVVKCPSLKKYPCKRNKGEHEYGEPIIKWLSVSYVYKSGGGILVSPSPIKDYKLLRTELNISTETHCLKCGHKAISFLTDNLK